MMIILVLQQFCNISIDLIVSGFYICFGKDEAENDKLKNHCKNNIFFIQMSMFPK